MDFQTDLENKTEEITKEAVNAGKKLFAFVVKEEKELLNGVFNVATFIPKHVLEGLSEKQETVYKGRQSIKKLVGSGAKLENIPIKENQTGIFKSVARKYGVDYSLKKCVDGDKTKYLVFFKAKDINVLDTAFKEFTVKMVENERKQSIKNRVKEDRQTARNEKTQNRERKREKKKDREEIL